MWNDMWYISFIIAHLKKKFMRIAIILTHVLFRRRLFAETWSEIMTHIFHTHARMCPYTNKRSLFQTVVARVFWNRKLYYIEVTRISDQHVHVFLWNKINILIMGETWFFFLLFLLIIYRLLILQPFKLNYKDLE